MASLPGLTLVYRVQLFRARRARALPYGRAVFWKKVHRLWGTASCLMFVWRAGGDYIRPGPLQEILIFGTLALLKGCSQYTQPRKHVFPRRRRYSDFFTLIKVGSLWTRVTPRTDQPRTSSFRLRVREGELFHAWGSAQARAQLKKSASTKRFAVLGQLRAPRARNTEARAPPKRPARPQGEVSERLGAVGGGTRARTILRGF